jgi:hypothetical protein
MSSDKNKELFPRPTKTCEKFYRGAFNYIKNDSLYSEESFEVYKDRKDGAFYFLSQIYSRVATGELLIIEVRYHVNKDYVPVYVQIKRALGEETVREVFSYDLRKGLMTYLFISDDEEVKKEFNAPPKFHITTPTVASSNLYLRSKKFDSTAKNYYSFYCSTNQWEYENPPFMKNVSVQKISSSAENITIEGQNLQAIEYRIYEDTQNKEDSPQDSYIKVHLSHHVTIPYLVKGDDGTKVQIKFLKNLTDIE